ncbi:hypothetical protein EGW08_022694 [Elysia chlorotica]|uniref:Uncharacterized protein n=1 Tax=Elysia chlorotica TaxID=188477 RepID=A0A3S1AVN7_ELYCH|nr:hypothetical protein EGW08_022694 [Elysia chlorotica]
MIEKVVENKKRGEDPMMDALMQTMAAMGTTGNSQQATPSMLGAGNNNNNNNDMLANLAKMFPQMMPSPPPTTTTPAPVVQNHNHNHNHNNNGMAGGFHGISNTQGINPTDLMALASAGLGSNNPAAAPRSINQLMGSMNPLQALLGGSGLAGLGALGGLGGVPGAALGGPGGPGGAGMGADPEKAAEQREEMLTRAMMASAMKSMMAPRVAPGGSNSTAGAKPQNPGMDILTMMALQNSLGGGGGASGGGMAAMMMLGGMSGSPAGMFGGGGGGMFGGLGSLFGA